MFQSPGSIAFTLGTIDIRWYGIIMSLSILLGLFVTIFFSKRYFKDISTDNICDLTFLLIFFGIIGARLYYVLMDLDYYIINPLEIPAVWHGGISIQGAIMGGVIAGYFYLKKHNFNFLRFADLFSFGLITGQIIGRWGNFFNSEAFGYPTNLPWRLYIPMSNRPFDYQGYDYFHPAFLYESILNFVIFLILYFLIEKCKYRKDGFIFFSYIILYSIVRLITETVRIDSVRNIGCIHVAHITSFIFIIIGLIGLFIISKKIYKNTEDNKL